VLAEIGDNQVIIWYNFKAERDILLETLGEKARAAGSPGPQRNQVINDFKKGEFQYLVAYPGSLGHGLTLTNAHYNLYYSISSNYDYMEQSAKRTHRKSQEKECYNIYLLAANTYDEILYKTVLKRESLKDATMAYLRGKQHG
jgi:ERCC4-related helicase